MSHELISSPVHASVVDSGWTHHDAYASTPGFIQSELMVQAGAPQRCALHSTNGQD